MFDRPRCRDWTPLATQQLRLRNLIQITGHNIECKKNSSLYYTLHMTSMSSPFFTSEQSDTPKNAMWSEINFQNIFELGSRSVCVRVWQHYNGNQTNSSLKITNSTAIQQDELLFLWGVYFSGLVQIPNRTSTQLKENALIFQMHGGFFTSNEYIIREYDINRDDKISLQSTSNSLKSDNLKIINKKLQSLNIQNCDGGGNLSRTNSLNSLNNSSPKNSFSNNDKLYNDSNDSQKIRFLSQDFYKSEIRPSYGIQKLLKLQEKQRWIKRKSQDSKDLMEKICMRSAFCLNLELIANKPLVYQQKTNTKPTGMGRTLNRLLFQQNQPPDPETLLKAQKIRRQIEIAKFRCRILSQERDRNKTSIRFLEKKLSELSDSNIELESWIMLHYRNLSRERDLILQEKIQFAGQKEIYANVKTSLRFRRIQLLKELNEIYVIKLGNNNCCYTINGVELPDAESYTEITLATDLSVSLGFVAHATILCSIILDVPLR